jgi:hypothetical protein
VTFRALEGDRVDVDGLSLTGANLLRFEGFRFVDDVDVGEGSSRVQLAGNELVGHRLWLYRTSDVLVEGNWVHDIPVGNSGGTIGVRLMHDVRAVVRGNLIENLVEDPIQVTNVTDTLLEGNVLRNAQPVSGQHTDTIHVLGANRLTIRGNVARNIAHGLMFTTFDPVDVTIENNVISQITEGVAMKGSGAGMPGLRMVNNTFWDSRYEVQFRTGHDGAVVRNNIFQAVSDLGDQPVAEHNLIGQAIPGTQYGTRAILNDPRFVDAAGGNFELAAGSPAIDAGTSVGAPTIDQRGRVRHDELSVPNTGTGTSPYYDLGALEHGTPQDQGGTHGAGGPCCAGAWRGMRPRGCRTGRRLLRAKVAGRRRVRVVRRRGITFRLERPPGHDVVRVVIRRVNGHRIFRGTKRIRRGVRRIRLRAPRLRRRLDLGRYWLEVRAGPTSRALDGPVCAGFRIVRR